MKLNKASSRKKKVNLIIVKVKVRKKTPEEV
jgi:hypothetical protein